MTDKDTLDEVAEALDAVARAGQLTDRTSAVWLDRALTLGARLVRNLLPPGLTREVMVQQFEVTGPTVVFVKATGARVSARRQQGRHVNLEAALYVSAGLQVTTQQDAFGIYVVALRKRVIGRLSRSDLRLTLPPDCDLIADLEHGDLHLNDMTGRVTVPAAPGKPKP